MCYHLASQHSYVSTSATFFEIVPFVVVVVYSQLLSIAFIAPSTTLSCLLGQSPPPHAAPLQVCCQWK